MSTEKMTFDVMEYIVWVIEIAANEFFDCDKTIAYDVLKNSELWKLYTEHYDVTHTLGADCILDEMRAYFIEHEVIVSC